jgi:hypothetical protein
MMLWCVSITPLGSPVLPLEKITVARSSSVRLIAPRAAFNKRYGSSHAINNAVNFSATRGFSNTSSSSKVRPGISILGKRSRNAFEVTVVCRLHWCPQEAITSLLAV